MNLLLPALIVLFQDPNVEQLIERLRSDKAEEREEATRKLKDAGEAALPLLEKAAKDSDSEVARRAREIVAAIPFEPGRKALEKLEETLHKSRGFRMRFRFEPEPGGTGAPPGSKGEGVLLLGEKGTMRFESTLFVGGEKPRVLMVSDGTHVGAAMNDLPPIVRDRPPELRENMVRGMIRAGVFISSIQRGVQDTKSYLTTKGHKLGEDGPGTRTLSYTLEVPGIGATADCKLWYDTASWTPRKRTISISQGEQIRYSITELYPEFVLDPEFPADAFKVPEAKK
jgi:outer membrane lipoprotein-sorting protein